MRRTETHARSLDPVWDEVFEFDGRGVGSAMGVSTTHSLAQLLSNPTPTLIPLTLTLTLILILTLTLTRTRTRTRTLGGRLRLPLSVRDLAGGQLTRIPTHTLL